MIFLKKVIAPHFSNYMNNKASKLWIYDYT